MKIAVLTSSRADYSIYYPLLKKLNEDSFFTLNIIAFGTHLSPTHGYTLNAILQDGFEVNYSVDCLPENDGPESISSNMGHIMSKFAFIWKETQFDLIFALGDRYEMFAAVASSIPFNLPIAHIHGGETTLGAIDNIFRHSLSLMSSFHFTSTDIYSKRVEEIIGSGKNIYNIGSLSIDNLKNLELLDIKAFKNKFDIDLSIPSILVTFHPETVSFENNKTYIHELINAFKELKDYQLVITMPNNDTMGSFIRMQLLDFLKESKNVKIVESFGTIGYLSCMKHCSFLLGNTSSGFVEAAFFPKFVINLGDRQKGRIITPNIINCEISRNDILKAVKTVENFRAIGNIDIYGNGNAADQIIKILKSIN